MHTKMMVALSCSLMVASVASAGGAGAKPSMVMPAKCMSIADTVMNTADFSTLLTALQAADLVDTLKSGQYTVFAPTNEAFNKLPSDVLAGVLNDSDMLKSVLLYHVVSGKVNAKQIMNLKNVKSAQGATLSVKMSGSKVMINGANVIAADIPACNGVIHVIDTVLMPPMSAVMPAPAPVAAAPAVPQPAPAPAPMPAPALIIPATPISMPTDMGTAATPALVTTDAAITDVDADTSMDATTTDTNTTVTTTETTTVAVPDTTTVAEIASNVVETVVDAAGAAVDTVQDATAAIAADNAADNTIYDVIVDDDRFSTLRSLLSDADLTETLMGGTYTLFAPTDEAFAKVDPDTLALIASDPEVLKQVLLYHVVAGNMTGEQVTAATQLASAEGASLNIAANGSTVKINDTATITSVDMTASNGVVHVIDSVLLPPDLKLPTP